MKLFKWFERKKTPDQLEKEAVERRRNVFMNSTLVTYCEGVVTVDNEAGINAQWIEVDGVLVKWNRL